MILLANLMNGIGYVLSMLLTLYMWLFIARAILSWVSPDPRNPIVAFINNVTEPILWRVRAKIPPLGVFDLSVMLVIIGLIFLELVVAQSLIDYAKDIKYQALIGK